MYKLTTLKADKHLAEIHQQLDIKFSFANIDVKEKKVIRIHEWVKCRDFLGDVIWANFYKKMSSIYGFQVDPKIQQLDQHHTLMLVKFPDTKTKQAFLANHEAILLEVETQNKLTPTQIIEIDEYTLLLKSDVFWQETIFLISLYTFLIKCSAYVYKDIKNWREEVTTFGTNEAQYMIRTRKTWNNFINNLKQIRDFSAGVSGYSKEGEQPIGTIHNNSGFVAIFNENNFLKDQNMFAGHFAELIGA